MMHCTPGNSCPGSEQAVKYPQTRYLFSWLADELSHRVRKAWLQQTGDRWSLLLWPFLALGFPASWNHLSSTPAWGTQCNSWNTPPFQLEHQTFKGRERQFLSTGYIFFPGFGANMRICESVLPHTFSLTQKQQKMGNVFWTTTKEITNN